MLVNPHDSNSVFVIGKGVLLESNFIGTDQRGENNLEDAISVVAKMMDITAEDIRQYGLVPSDNGLTETDADKIKRLLE